MDFEVTESIGMLCEENSSSVLNMTALFWKYSAVSDRQATIATDIVKWSQVNNYFLKSLQISK